MIHKLPIIGVNHLEGHLYAPFLKDKQFLLNKNFDEPFVGLCVSGGHTSLVHAKKFGSYTTIGRTLDDAAGEAFDKFGKLLGLGYPAGRLVDELAKKGNRTAYDFPRPLLKNPGLDFSFSGLKTAGSVELKKLLVNSKLEDVRNDLCASYQEAIVDVLLEKLTRALTKTKLIRAVISGGVSSNSRLREKAQIFAMDNKLEILIPPPRYCTDNAAMIGFAGIQRLNRGEMDGLNLTALATQKNAEIG